MNQGSFDDAMELFPFKSTQIKLIWRQAIPADVDPSVRLDFTTKKKENSVLIPKYNQESLVTAIQWTPLSQRRNLRSLSNATLIPQSTLDVIRKNIWFLQHSNAVKPFLMEANKISCLQFSNSFVNPWNQHFNTMC